MRWRVLDNSALIVPPGGAVCLVALACSASTAAASTVPLAACNPSTTPLLLVALVVMALATAVAVATSIYLYRWRRILLADPHLLVPEELGKYLDGLAASIAELSDATNHRLKTVGDVTAQNSEGVARMIETFMTLQTAVDERDAEIRRHRSGYDSQIYRRFVNRFIRVDQFIDALLESEPAGTHDLRQIKRLLQDALDECGVESFTPELGADSRKADGIADNPKTEMTGQAEDAFKIVEVIEPGYRLNGGAGAEVLLPAKVKIAVFEA